MSEVIGPTSHLLLEGLMADKKLAMDEITRFFRF